MPAVPTWFDALLLLVLLLSLWTGWRRGLLDGAAGLLALLASLGLAWAMGPWLAQWAVAQGWIGGVWALPAALVLVYLLARVLLGALLGRGLSAVPARAHRHLGNRLLGLLPGAAHGFIHVLLLLLIGQSLPMADAASRGVRDSVVARSLAPPADWLHGGVSDVFAPAWNQAMRRTAVQPGSPEVLELPFRATHTRARPELEAQMLELVNRARGAHGLEPLRDDPQATEVARAHSRDMLARGYFAHVSPQGENPFDRLRRSGLRYRAAGENLALARNLAQAHQGLMDSPGHRANILQPAFGRLGIGIVDAGRHGLMVTQAFRD